MSEGRVHLGYLDGLRGWAALLVVMHHVWQLTATQRGLNAPRWFSLTSIFQFGGFAVTTFIVLSGYCLMLPVVKRRPARLPAGVKTFLLRRARRILPPYYATLALTLGLIAVFPSLRVRSDSQWNIALPAFNPAAILPHLSLVHNLARSWQWKVDPPLWSVALEWQIYFFFGICLVPLWRRIGAWTVIVAFAVGLTPLIWGGGFANSWLVGSFGLGMLAAAINFPSGQPRAAWLAGTRGVWMMAIVLVPAVSAVLIARLRPLSVLIDSSFSVAIAIFLVRSTEQTLRSQPGRLLRALTHPWSMTLGGFSYSLYLIHYPLLALFAIALRGHGVAPATAFAILAAIGLPVVLVASSMFYRVFERPFMSRDRATDPTEAASVAPGTAR